MSLALAQCLARARCARLPNCPLIFTVNCELLLKQERTPVMWDP